MTGTCRWEAVGNILEIVCSLFLVHFIDAPSIGTRSLRIYRVSTRRTVSRGFEQAEDGRDSRGDGSVKNFEMTAHH